MRPSRSSQASASVMVDVCVTGASGFVGRHVINRLTRESDLSVIALSRQSMGGAEFRSVRGDLLQPDSLRSFVTPGSIVIHLAYSGAPGFDNCKAAENLARVSLDQGAAKFVHVSTAVVVGRCRSERIDESTPCTPSNPYEREKLEIEHRLSSMMNGPLELRIVRPTAVFGPGGQNLVALTSFLRSASRMSIAARMMLMGKRRLNLVAVENVAEAILHVSRLNGPNPGPLIVTDDHAAGNHYVNVAQRLMEGIGIAPIVPPIDLSFLLPVLLRASGRTLSNPATTFSASRLRATGYHPVIAFDDAVRRFGVWMSRQSNDDA